MIAIKSSMSMMLRVIYYQLFSIHDEGDRKAGGVGKVFLS